MTTTRPLTKADFKRELRKETNATLMLRMQQLSNEFPAYASVILSAFAAVAASR